MFWCPSELDASGPGGSSGPPGGGDGGVTADHQECEYSYNTVLGNNKVGIGGCDYEALVHTWLVGFFSPHAYHCFHEVYVVPDLLLGKNIAYLFLYKEHENVAAVFQSIFMSCSVYLTKLPTTSFNC